jgi:hypothetical protein
MSALVVPDVLYGIEHLIDGEKRYRFFALECENRSPKRRTTAKLSSQRRMKRRRRRGVLRRQLVSNLTT